MNFDVTTGLAYRIPKYAMANTIVTILATRNLVRANHTRAIQRNSCVTVVNVFRPRSYV